MHPFLLLPAIMFGFVAGSLRRGNNQTSSPIANVSLLAWERFVAVMAAQPKDHVDDKYRLGAFGMDARKLKDVGVMSAAAKGVRDGKSGVWMGTFTPPLTEKAFLGSMPLQYAAFVRSMRAAVPKVTRHVGTKVANEPVSLSGLLGVAHAAGEAGVESWIADPGIRRRFSRTTQTFDRTNGLF